MNLPGRRPRTPAQDAQQDNRVAAGRYGEKRHGDPQQLHLDTDLTADIASWVHNPDSHDPAALLGRVAEQLNLNAEPEPEPGTVAQPFEGNVMSWAFEDVPEPEPVPVAQARDPFADSYIRASHLQPGQSINVLGIWHRIERIHEPWSDLTGRIVVDIGGNPDLSKVAYAGLAPIPYSAGPVEQREAIDVKRGDRIWSADRHQWEIVQSTSDEGMSMAFGTDGGLIGAFDYEKLALQTV